AIAAALDLSEPQDRVPPELRAGRPRDTGLPAHRLDPAAARRPVRRPPPDAAGAAGGHAVLTLRSRGAVACAQLRSAADRRGDAGGGIFGVSSRVLTRRA